MTAPIESIARVESWFLKHQRALPWRTTPSPYRTWISEVMLQQTTVSAVLPYFERFTGRFPTLNSLATAPLEDVLALWSGLGYYSRARNLWRGARAVSKDFHGEMPRNVTNLQKIPGVGRYTAGAISSIAFGVRAPIVDGNVKRVFARFYAIASSVDSPKTVERLWKLAQVWVDHSKSPGDLNQGLMEIGALICKKSSPLCDSCPLNSECRALKTDRVDKLPVRKIFTEKSQLHWLTLVYTSGNRLYLENNPNSRWWKGLWDTPYIALKSETELIPKLKRAQKERGALTTPLGRRRHTVTTHQITVDAYQIELKRQHHFAPYGRWFDRDQVPTLATSSLVRKVLVSLEL